MLCRPSHPGNIGAAARAMKTMGLADLRLVEPERYPAPEADWMATNAVDVLKGATLHASLEDSIRDCVAAFAMSARPREWSPQVLDARSAAARAMALEGDVAFVFGNETAGLTNEEVFACQYLVHIPASAEFSSLNLAQAVQVMAYELFMAQAPEPEPVRELVDVDRMEARIAGEHFPCGACRGVPVEDAGDIGTELGEHESHLRVSDCFDQLFAAHFPSRALSSPRMIFTSSRSSPGTREKSRRQRSRSRDPLAMKFVCLAASSKWA